MSAPLLPEHTPDPSNGQRAATGTQGNLWSYSRTIVLALLLAPITVYWTRDQRVDSMSSLLIPPVMMTLLVALGNRILRRIHMPNPLSEGELVVFYGMHSIMGALSAEWMTLINPYIHSYALYPDSDGNFRRYITPYTHPWFFISPGDASKFQDYRHGGFSAFYFLSRLSLWWPYIASWTLLVTLLCLAMLCINSLMQDTWRHPEKLAFPIIQLPMAIVQFGAGTSPLYKQRTFFLPFSVLFCIDILNGFHFFTPTLPWLNLRYFGDLVSFFPTPPLNAIGQTPVGIFPYLAAIGFFIPSRLLFSVIFFFFFRKFQQVILCAAGYATNAGDFGGSGLLSGPPYFSEQSWGAFLAIFVVAIWMAKDSLREIGRQILLGSPASRPFSAAFSGILSTSNMAIGLAQGIQGHIQPIWSVNSWSNAGLRTARPLPLC